MYKLVVRNFFKNKKTFSCILAALSMAALFSVQVLAFSPENEEEVKKKLSEILASGEFGEQKRSKSLLEILHDKFIEFIKKLWEKLNIGDKLESVFGGAKVSPEVMLILKIIAIVLMLAIIVLVIFFVTRKFTRARKVRQEDALLLNELKNPDEVYKKAFDYYNSGDYTQGLRFLYISLLIKFNELNIIRINKAKTNKQYLSEIRDNKPEIYDVMIEFTQVFNRHWYGGRNADKATFVSWNDVYNKLI